MDSRDSSSLLLPDTKFDDNYLGVTEEDALLSETAGLAKDAFVYFQSGQYAECVDVLNQLSLKKPDDHKVRHNIAIAEAYQCGCTDTKKLLEGLDYTKITKKLAPDSQEQVDPGSKVNSLSRESSNQHDAGSGACTAYREECDTSVATFNIAVVWFHLHEYAKALAVVEPLFENIEHVNETTAVNICFLLLDVLLACNDAPKSANVLLYLEKVFEVGCQSQSENGSLAQQQPTNSVAKSSSVPTNNTSATYVPSSDFTSGANSVENLLSRTLSEEALEYDSMFLLDMAGQNLQKPARISASNNFSTTLTEKCISTTDFKLKFLFYKVRFLLLTENIKQAKREVKHAINIARGRDSSTALFLKAQLEYARGNYPKAIKLLMASGNRTETAILSTFNNNLGCIYYQLGKFNASSNFFSRALSNGSLLRKEKPMNLLTFSQDKSITITYNCGVQYLVSGRPLLAARCFKKATVMFYNRPLLWLQLAECCLLAFVKGLLRVGPTSSEINVHVIGKGKWRQLAVVNGITKNGGHVERTDSPVSTDGQPELSLVFGRQCLFNALHLINSVEAGYVDSSVPSRISLEENEANVGQIDVNGRPKDQKVSSSHETIQNSVSRHEEMRRSKNLLIKQSILANLAYIELELKNPLKALSSVKSLLEIAECSKVYIYLGHIYATEALCMLNKPKEAAEHLSVYLSGEDKFELPFSQVEREQLQQVGKNADSKEFNPESARGTLCANFAALLAIQGEYDRARHFVREALALIPNNSQATLTAIYLDLVEGKSQEAVAKLKKCSQVRFLPNNYS